MLPGQWATHSLMIAPADSDSESRQRVIVESQDPVAVLYLSGETAKPGGTHYLQVRHSTIVVAESVSICISGSPKGRSSHVP